jgi:hypothetical protein
MDHSGSYETLGEVMHGWFQAACNPFTPESTSCDLGDYATYSINVSSAKDIIADIGFSKTNNVRLVTKNKGHEYVTTCGSCDTNMRSKFQHG